jgi:hypothetical protein
MLAPSPLIRDSNTSPSKCPSALRIPLAQFRGANQPALKQFGACD